MSPTAPPLPVVVGVDGTALSRDALVFALEEGALRGAVVRVVMAWTFGTTLHDAVPGESLETESALVLAELEDVLTQGAAADGGGCRRRTKACPRPVRGVVGRRSPRRLAPRGRERPEGPAGAELSRVGQRLLRAALAGA